MARGYVVEKNGRWYIQIFDDTGRSTMRSVAKELGKKDATEKDAQKLLRRRLSEADNGGVAYSAKITLDKYLHDWIQLKKPTIAQSTYECYLEKIDKHIVPRIGDLRLDQLNKATMKRFLNSLIDDGVGTRTIQLTMRQVLSQALTQACEDDLLTKNPMQGIHTPAYTRKEKIMWTDKELNAFLAVAKERPLYPVYMLAITTGMRRGEILALTWRDIDLVTGEITIDKQLTPDREIKKPKTAGSKRKVFVPAEVVEILKMHREKQRAWLDALGKPININLPAFTSDTGTYYFPRNVLRDFKVACQQAGVPVICLHDCRHLYVSLAIDAGISLKTIQSEVGHSKLSTTTDTYAHIINDDENKKSAAVKVADRLKNIM